MQFDISGVFFLRDPGSFRLLLEIGDSLCDADGDLGFGETKESDEFISGVCLEQTQ